MRQLYIANGTHQAFGFCYRIPEVKGHRTQHIKVGGQMIISGKNLTDAQFSAIIKQYEKYGMINAERINDPGRKPAPLAYQYDKPFTKDQIDALVNRNRGVLMDMGDTIRKNTAASIGATIGQMVKNQTGVDTDAVDVDITQEADKKGDRPEDAVDASITAVRENKQDAVRSRRGR